MGKYHMSSKKQNRGQNLVEFAIIMALIVFASITALTMLGSNVKDMFSKSDKSYKQYKPFDWNSPNHASSGSNTSGNNGNTTETEVIDATGTSRLANNKGGNDINNDSSETMDVNGVQVTMNNDGSASFAVLGQNVNLSSEVINDMYEVLDTAGAHGVPADLVNEIAYMIQQHKSDYPGQDVPIDIKFGDSKRHNCETGMDYVGSAELNLVTLKVDDHVVIITNDNTCGTSNNGGNTCNESSLAKYRIEGNIDENNKLQASLTRAEDTLSTNYSNNDIGTANFQADINGDSTDFKGLVMNNLKFTNGETADWSWNVNF